MNEIWAMDVFFLDQITIDRTCAFQKARLPKLGEHIAPGITCSFFVIDKLLRPQPAELEKSTMLVPKWPKGSI